jgi:hypothetical protein
MHAAPIERHVAGVQQLPPQQQHRPLAGGASASQPFENTVTLCEGRFQWHNMSRQNAALLINARLQNPVAGRQFQ